MTAAAGIAGGAGILTVVAFAWWVIRKLLAAKDAEKHALLDVADRRAKIAELSTGLDHWREVANAAEDENQRLLDKLQRLQEGRNDLLEKIAEHGGDPALVDELMRDSLRDLQEGLPGVPGAATAEGG